MGHDHSVQHVNVKIFARQAEIDLADAIPVFHRWIQEDLRDEMLVDVADYRHVPEGPGVILVAHEAIYGLDLAEGRLGLLYNRKGALDGDTQANLRQAFMAALSACRLLEEEAPFAGKLRFDPGDCEVIINDRLIAPNTEETWQALRPELERFFGGLYGPGQFTLEWRGEPRDRFRVGVKANAPLDTAALRE
jgi:hypothetical protein